MRRILAVDSDGCAIDVMEAKHKKCFTPATIECWELENIKDAVIEITEKVNLYSKKRGINRFEGLVLTFDLLSKHSEVKAKGFDLPDISPLRELTDSGILSLDRIAHLAEEKNCDILNRVVQWSQLVNRKTKDEIVPSAFSEVQKTLADAARIGLQIKVVSSANEKVIREEWQAVGLSGFVDGFYGQESGPKADVLFGFVESGVEATNILMVGDAPGDMEAAVSAETFFFPIIAGEENRSWSDLRKNYLPKFMADNFSRSQQALICAFDERLPEL